MFGNLGFSEMLVILAVALIVFGPQRLPDIARSLGKALGHFRRTAADLRSTVEREVRSSELGGALDEARSLARLADPRIGPLSAPAFAPDPVATAPARAVEPTRDADGREAAPEVAADTDPAPSLADATEPPRT